MEKNNFNVESMYPMSIFKDSQINYSWSTIKVGWDLQRLTIDEIGKFALDYMEANLGLVNRYISELIFSEIDSYDMDECLNKVFTSLDLIWPEKESCLWNQEWRKWRFCILNAMVKHIENEEELLYKIEGLYADFGYPIDMKPFIYYMPICRCVDNEERFKGPSYFMKRINGFIAYERNLIDTCYEYLPEKIY